MLKGKQIMLGASTRFYLFFMFFMNAVKKSCCNAFGKLLVFESFHSSLTNVCTQKHMDLPLRKS